MPWCARLSHTPGLLPWGSPSHSEPAAPSDPFQPPPTNDRYRRSRDAVLQKARRTPAEPCSEEAYISPYRHQDRAKSRDHGRHRRGRLPCCRSSVTRPADTRTHRPARGSTEDAERQRRHSARESLFDAIGESRSGSMKRSGERSLGMVVERSGTDRSLSARGAARSGPRGTLPVLGAGPTRPVERSGRFSGFAPSESSSEGSGGHVETHFDAKANRAVMIRCHCSLGRNHDYREWADVYAPNV